MSADLRQTSGGAEDLRSGSSNTLSTIDEFFHIGCIHVMRLPYPAEVLAERGGDLPASYRQNLRTNGGKEDHLSDPTHR